MQDNKLSLTTKSHITIYIHGVHFQSTWEVQIIFQTPFKGLGTIQTEALSPENIEILLKSKISHWQIMSGPSYFHITLELKDLWRRPSPHWTPTSILLVTIKALPIFYYHSNLKIWHGWDFVGPKPMYSGTWTINWASNYPHTSIGKHSSTWLGNIRKILAWFNKYKNADEVIPSPYPMFSPTQGRILGILNSVQVLCKVKQMKPWALSQT